MTDTGELERLGDGMKELGFKRLVGARADILGKPLTLLHWAGATESVVLETWDDAFRAFSNGWTRYRLDQNGNGTETATETVNCTVNSENALDDESEKT